MIANGDKYGTIKHKTWNIVPVLKWQSNLRGKPWRDLNARHLQKWPIFPINFIQITQLLYFGVSS